MRRSFITRRQTRTLQEALFSRPRDAASRRHLCGDSDRHTRRRSRLQRSGEVGAVPEAGKILALQAMTPNALAEHFDTTRQAVSKHLRILTECELVSHEQRGREIYYSLEIEKMKEIDKWMEQYRKIWESRFEQLGEVLKVMKKKEREK